MPSRFVHLHTHSHYSLLEALPKVKELLGHVKKLEMDAVALTDNGALYGAIEFYQKAEEMGIKPILGLDAYVAKHGRHQKRHRIDTKPHRLVLLAETEEGYRNLLQLSSVGFLEGFYYKPRIDKELLAQHSTGIIALSGGHFGEIHELLRIGNEEEARNVACSYAALFGKDQFFLELVDRPEIAEQETLNAKLIQMGKELGIPVVATKDTYYIKPENVEAWKILNCIKGGKTLEQFDRQQQFDYDASVVSGEYMEERFKDIPEAIENTRVIADRCSVKLELGNWNFPQFSIPEGKTFREVMAERAYEGLKEQEGEITDTMRQRMEYEIEIIDQKGFCPYFLIVSDFISWAKSQGIVTTTRGSAAGSLVGYSMRISGFNPLTYSLPFERFLNPERPSAPDIDADFADNRRDEVLDYVRQKYGHEKVAQICTFGKMLARGSVRDVGRALGLPYGFCDVVAKLVPMGSQGFPMTLARALEETPDLKKMYDTDPECRRVIDLAQQIEGCGRHVSIHAAGTVIAPEALTSYTPLQIDTREGKVITQYEMKSVESAGLVKMDFLGIRNLSILGDAVQIVQKTKNVSVVLETIPLNDQKTFDLLANGHTMGVFQLSGDGMTKYLMELKPTRVEDIMAMVALYRPGPIESIPEYIRRKYDASLITYPDERLREILEASYGVIVYQDDVMLIAIKLAGYSWLEADKLRKAMGKKIPEEMAQQKVKLLEGFVEHGLSQEKANHLWKLIEPFAAYGFNKAHAASYGMIAYYTAYMKATYPAEYMTALMTAEVNDLEKIAEAVVECKRLGITVLPPDINDSRADFTFMDDTSVRFGLLAIKGLGEEFIAALIAERKERGAFVDITDFAARMAHRSFNKKSLECLIKSGALDRFGERNSLLENMERLLIFNKTTQKEKAQNQATLFEVVPSEVSNKIQLKPAPPAPIMTKLQWEKTLLGLYLSGHPFDQSSAILGPYLTSCTDVASLPDGTFVRCGGVITFLKAIQTKKGEMMAFMGIQDHTGQTEVILFPKTYAQYKDVLKEDALFLVAAKASRRDGEEETKLLANGFIAIDADLEGLAHMLRVGMWVEDAPSSDEESVLPPPPASNTHVVTLAEAAPPIKSEELFITLTGSPAADTIARLRGLFEAHPGLDPVCFHVEAGGRLRKVQTDYRVRVTPEVLDELAVLVGRQNVHTSNRQTA